ncbi:argininosuccinate lyase [Streptosporangium becharense]|uniref:Argininosuccinate lyase n=1 Tax=Streptosporangium becharense TaxID=1816182 RepID=A0A7W9MK99_9ACTN|nr:lyase family protein [Streptosporangium becharense]MBB2914578.1 argininosuccinate lyase [Streptosporangium becharense]MBB5823423.1 argininosuccinate lyase [Streptosporangium becharense]
MLPTGRTGRTPQQHPRGVAGATPDGTCDQAVRAGRPGSGGPALLRHYRWIELTHIDEYVRMGLMGGRAAARIRRAVLDLTPEELHTGREAAGSDPLPALERSVQARLPEGAYAWHVDRSRNDVRACARLMLGRERLLETAAAVSGLARTALETAGGHTESIMPASSRPRTAQTITFGFYLAALAEAATDAAESFHSLFDAVNLCPLGAGAMAGLELPWDRARIALALGFDGPQPHALTSVASQAWALRSAAELSVLGTTLSRFLTDLIGWSGPGCRFVDLPGGTADDPMTAPQEGDGASLERIRDMARRLVGLSHDVMAGQHDTGYTDLAEVSGPGPGPTEDLFATCGATLALFDRAVAGMRFHPERAGRAVRGELTAFLTVANHLTLEHGVPAGISQAVVGSWISAATGGLGPAGAPTPDLLSAAGLVAAGERHGFVLAVEEDEVRELLDAEAGVRRKQTGGSTRPEEVRLLLEQVGERLAAVDVGAARRSGWLREAWEHTTGTKTGDPR